MIYPSSLQVQILSNQGAPKFLDNPIHSIKVYVFRCALFFEVFVFLYYTGWETYGMFLLQNVFWKLK